MQDAELREIETAASAIALEAGRLLMRHFRGPLEVSYKSENHRNPVTDADKAVDEYIRGEIARRFPTHAVLTEEHAPADERAADVMWVVDPLDGTTNFLNGLPAFGVLVGVLERGMPVAGAIFVPSIDASEGHVIHARLGGGAHLGERRLSIGDGDQPRNSQISTFPAYWLRAFDIRANVRRNLGDIRSMGSTAFEQAMLAMGVLQYVVFNGPHIWDVAAGVIVAREAGAKVAVYSPRRRQWLPFERFARVADGGTLTQDSLRGWRPAIILGTPKAVDYVTAGIRPRSFRWRRMWRDARAWWRRRTAKTSAAAPSEASQQPAATQPTGQDRRGR
ncbi:MAG: inositol monophosphatase [SAR202 cluster bacterium]|nr:inositol monophosphatase [SAR202 cluster bacterium]